MFVCFVKYSSAINLIYYRQTCSILSAVVITQEVSTKNDQGKEKPWVGMPAEILPPKCLLFCLCLPWQGSP
jgi:hypothetical protein